MGGEPAHRIRGFGVRVLIYQEKRKPYQKVHDCGNYDGNDIDPRFRGLFLFLLHLVTPFLYALIIY